MIMSAAKTCVCLLLLIGICGCGQAGDGPTTAPVTGTVTYNGQPVEDALVTFSPNDSGQAATGRTDEQGEFEMTTVQPGDGVVPGSYTVLVSKIVTTGTMSAEEATAHTESTGTPPPPPQHDNQLPEKYNNPQTSDLTADVSQGGDNHVTLELTD